MARSTLFLSVRRAGIVARVTIRDLLHRNLPTTGAWRNEKQEMTENLSPKRKKSDIWKAYKVGIIKSNDVQGEKVFGCKLKRKTGKRVLHTTSKNKYSTIEVIGWVLTLYGGWNTLVDVFGKVFVDKEKLKKVKLEEKGEEAELLANKVVNKIEKKFIRHVVESDEGGKSGGSQDLVANVVVDKEKLKKMKLEEKGEEAELVANMVVSKLEKKFVRHVVESDEVEKSGGSEDLIANIVVGKLVDNNYVVLNATVVNGACAFGLFCGGALLGGLAVAAYLLKK